MGCSLPGSSFLVFSRQEYWAGFPFPSPGDLPDPGIEPGSPALQADSLPTELRGKPSVVQSSYKQYISEWVYLCSRSDLQWQAAGATTENYHFIDFSKPLFIFSYRENSEKAMAPHSSTLAWKIPWTEEPGRLQSMGSLESDITERLHFHFSLSCIGEGNGNPLQCSCLENPRDGGAWWAAVYGVAQSQTRLKRLSSSSIVRLMGVLHVCMWPGIRF